MEGCVKLEKQILELNVNRVGCKVGDKVVCRISTKSKNIVIGKTYTIIDIVNKGKGFLLREVLPSKGFSAFSVDKFERVKDVWVQLPLGKLIKNICLN